MQSLFGDISALLQHSPWLAIVAVFLGGVTTALNPCVLAMIPLLMGLPRLGVLKLNFPVPAGLRVKKQGYVGAFLLGLLFGVVSTPCAVPILAVLLAFVAGKANVLYGGFLLFVFRLGHSALVLVAGTSVGAAKGLLESKGLRKAHSVIQKIAGVLIIGIG